MADLILDRVARSHRKNAGAGHQQFGARVAAGRVEGVLDGGHGALLGVGVGTRGTRLQEQQGARAVARGPGTVDQARRCAVAGLFEQLHHFPGRVAR